MRKKIFCFLLMIPVSIGLSSAASSQIVVEDADFIWKKALDSTEFPDISPCVTAEYTTTIYDTDLIPPIDLELPARIIVEYATEIAQFESARFPACECDLNHDHNCDMQDWLIFGKDWGRTNCHEAGVECECDLNNDGRCDMQDWLLFGEDWGRTDCPVPYISSEGSAGNVTPIVTGGPCEYRIYDGEARIISIRRKELPTGYGGPSHESYEVKFSFSAEEAIKEAHGKVEGKQYTLKLTNSWYPGPKFLEKYGIEEGKSFDCYLKVITKGTCTPVIFDFPTIDLSDYFESRR